MLMLVLHKGTVYVLTLEPEKPINKQTLWLLANYFQILGIVTVQWS